MTLDPHTLLFSLLLINVLIALGLFLVVPGRKRGARAEGIGKWALAIVLEAVTWGVASLRGDVPDAVSIVLANGLKACVHALALAAVYEFQQRTCPRWQCLVPVALSLLMASLLLDDARGRVFWNSVIYGYQIWLIGRALLDAHAARGGRAWKLLFGGVVLALLVLTVRAATSLHGTSEFAQPLSGTPNPAQLATYVLLLGTSLLGSVGFVFMVKERSDQEIMRLATTDSLTQVYNRHALMQFAEQTFARRDGQNLALFMMDVDHFKVINDTHGHPAGDEVLRQVAGLLKSRLRRSDIIGRYGGEEFCVIVPDTTAYGAHTLAESLREIMAATAMTTGRGPVGVTVSIGISHCPFGETRGLEQMLAEADSALYTAKQNGRNRVVLFAGSDVDETVVPASRAVTDILGG